MEHAKGKWEVFPEPDGHFSVLSDKSITVWRSPNAEAYARLISAAPDLLAAIKGNDENAIPNIPAILAQALLGNYEAVKTMLSELCSINAKAIAKAEK
jgi:hypothetical protein